MSRSTTIPDPKIFKLDVEKAVARSAETARNIALRSAALKKQELELEVRARVRAKLSPRDEKGGEKAIMVNARSTKSKVAATRPKTEEQLEEEKLEAIRMRIELEKKKIEIEKASKKAEERSRERRLKEQLKQCKEKLIMEHNEEMKKQEKDLIKEERKFSMINKLLFEKKYDPEDVALLLDGLYSSPQILHNTKHASPKTKSKKIILIDASGSGTPLNIRNLMVLRWNDKEGRQHRISITGAMKSKWQSLCDIMEIPNATVEYLVRNCRRDEEKCCRAILTYWLENGSPAYSATWEGLLALLEDLQLSSLFSKLDEAILNGKSI